jgi:type II secretion system protein N
MRLTGNLSSRKLAAGIGYVAFAVASLLVGLYFTFPAEAVGQRLAHEVRTSSGGQYTITFKELAPYRLSGFAAESVRLRTAKPGEAPVEIELDALKVRLRLLPLLLARLSAAASIELGKGSLDAVVTKRATDAYDADLSIDELNLASPPLLPRLAGITFAGIINGSATAALRPDPKASTGKASFKLANVSIGPGTVQGLTLPLIELGTLTPELVIDGGRARVASFKQEGGQVQLKVSGQATLREKLEQSVLDLCVQVRPDPAFIKRNPTLEPLTQLAEVRFRRDAQGFLNISVGGTVGAPMTRPGLCHGNR